MRISHSFYFSLLLTIHTKDLVPPTITLLKPPPTHFLNDNHAEKWYENNILFFDDCVPSGLLTSEITVAGGFITVSVKDERCEIQPIEYDDIHDSSGVQVNGPGEFQTIKNFPYLVDSCPLYEFSSIRSIGDFNSRSLRGEGCDGMDNDCDSSFVDSDGNEIVPVRRVDECDEGKTS